MEEKVTLMYVGGILKKSFDTIDDDLWFFMTMSTKKLESSLIMSTRTRWNPPIGFVVAYFINHDYIGKNIESPQKLGNNESSTSFIDLSNRFRGDLWVTPDTVDAFR